MDASAELDGQIALVTGASRGIGRAIAERFAAAGATVVGTATGEAGAEAIGARLAESGASGTGMVLELGDADGPARVVDAVAERFGAVTVLVNNAGITRDNLFLRMKDEEWQSVIDTNLGGAYRLCRQVVRPMVKARGGRIVNVSSVVGLTGNAGQVNYAASKAGLIGMTRALARELGARGITVNAVAPGFVESDMTDALPEEQKERLRAEIALGRLGTPADVAEACLFLASKRAAWITGQTLGVNGGMHMH